MGFSWLQAFFPPFIKKLFGKKKKKKQPTEPALHDSKHLLIPIKKKWKHHFSWLCTDHIHNTGNCCTLLTLRWYRHSTSYSLILQTWQVIKQNERKLRLPVLCVTPFLQIQENFLCWLWAQFHSADGALHRWRANSSTPALLHSSWFRTTLFNLHLALARDFCMNYKLFPPDQCKNSACSRTSTN